MSATAVNSKKTPFADNAKTADSEQTASSKKKRSKLKKKKKKKKNATPSLIELLGRPKQSPLLWSLPDSRRTQPQAKLIKKLYRTTKPKDWQSSFAATIDAAIDQPHEQICEVDLLAVLALVYCYSDCPKLVKNYDVSKIIGRVCSHSEQSNQYFDLQFEPLLSQLLNVELPLAIAIGLSATEPNQEWLESAVANFHESVAQLLDGNGWPEGRLIADFGLLAASWTRCFHLLQKSDIEIGVEVIEQLEWMVRQFMRLLRADGSLMLGETGTGISHDAFGKMLLELSEDKIDKRLAKLCYPKSKTPKKLKIGMPDEFDVSEWAQVAATRSSWARRGSRAAVSFHDHQTTLEVSNSEILILGECTPEISINGKPLASSEVIEVACTHLEDDIDYLELELTYGEVTVQRQIVFNRTDQFLYLSDIVMPPEASRIDYQCTFPVGPNIQPLPESETTEVYLKSDKFHGLVLPLCLPEWKSERTDDRFSIVENGLRLSQSIDGKGLCASLFIDLSEKRCVKPRTWRRLTVAEKLKVVGKDDAAAFRVQVGKQQWLFYRAIGDAQNRTFLGENFSSEFYVGSMDRDGEVQSLLEIESEEWE